MNAIDNERVKLTATALNNTAVAVIVTGVIVPSASFLYGLATVPQARFWWLIALAWLVGGIALHAGARLALGRLK